MTLNYAQNPLQQSIFNDDIYVSNFIISILCSLTVSLFFFPLDYAPDKRRWNVLLIENTFQLLTFRDKRSQEFIQLKLDRNS